MRIVKEIVSLGHGDCTDKYLVVHETANKGVSARQHLNYWKSAEYMAHYITDWNSDIVYNAVAENKLCYHCGNANKISVGIELCHAKTKSQFEKVWSNAIEFCVYWLKLNNKDISYLKSHNDMRLAYGGTTHTDPLDYFNEFGKNWNEFKEEVNRKLNNVIESEIENMRCLYKIKGNDTVYYFDGYDECSLTSVEQMKVIQMIYKDNTGKDIPFYEWSNSNPWYTRLREVIARMNKKK